MIWYSAHIIMFVEFKQAAQDRYPVWENVVIIQAATEDEAFEKAESYGRAEEGDDSGLFRWGKQPAKWIFAGVRRLTECQFDADGPGDGTEVTYIEMELGSREAVKKLAAGKPVQVEFNDRFRPVAKGSSKTKGEPKQSKRRRA